MMSGLKAQDSTRTFILKTDIFSPVYMSYFKDISVSLSGEYCFKRYFSAQLTGEYTNILVDSRARNFESWRVIYAFKYFLARKKAHAGLFTGFYGKFSSLTSTYNYNSEPEPFYLSYRTKSINGGLILGYQNYIGKHFSIDLIFGLGLRKVTNIKVLKMENITYIPDSRQNPLDGIIAVNIGYRF
jgi:hypothetical protein